MEGTVKCLLTGMWMDRLVWRCLGRTCIGWTRNSSSLSASISRRGKTAERFTVACHTSVIFWVWVVTLMRNWRNIPALTTMEDVLICAWRPLVAPVAAPVQLNLCWRRMSGHVPSLRHVARISLRVWVEVSTASLRFGNVMVSRNVKMNLMNWTALRVRRTSFAVRAGSVFLIQSSATESPNAGMIPMKTTAFHVWRGSLSAARIRPASTKSLCVMGRMIVRMLKMKSTSAPCPVCSIMGNRPPPSTQWGSSWVSLRSCLFWSSWCLCVAGRTSTCRWTIAGTLTWWWNLWTPRSHRPRHHTHCPHEASQAQRVWQWPVGRPARSHCSMTVTMSREPRQAAPQWRTTPKRLSIHPRVRWLTGLPVLGTFTILPTVLQLCVHTDRTGYGGTTGHPTRRPVLRMSVRRANPTARSATTPPSWSWVMTRIHFTPHLPHPVHTTSQMRWVAPLHPPPSAASLTRTLRPHHRSAPRTADTSPRQRQLCSMCSTLGGSTNSKAFWLQASAVVGWVHRGFRTLTLVSTSKRSDKTLVLVMLLDIQTYTDNSEVLSLGGNATLQTINPSQLYCYIVWRSQNLVTNQTQDKWRMQMK